MPTNSPQHHSSASAPDGTLGHALTWEELSQGRRLRTGGRTVTQADIGAFVARAGFTEPLFLDMEYVREHTPFRRRIAPGVLTLAIAEGLVIQTGMLHGTGIALLALRVQVTSPLFEDDTIHVEIEVTQSRATSKGPHQGIVTTANRVVNQHDTVLLEYEAVRLMRGGHPAPSGHATSADG